MNEQMLMIFLTVIIPVIIQIILPITLVFLIVRFYKNTKSNSIKNSIRVGIAGVIIYFLLGMSILPWVAQSFPLPVRCLFFPISTVFGILFVCSGICSLTYLAIDGFVAGFILTSVIILLFKRKTISNP
ncbi:MAG: hypothetical protein WCT19_04835 [Candidatus Paceibacterota bacterium]|jgi:hypothetical protein